MSDKGLSKDIYAEIVEAVKHGIVSSKQSESALIRDIQIILNRIEDSQIYLKSEIKDIKDSQKEQSSKVFKLAEVVDEQKKEIVSLGNWRSWTTGIATATALLIGTIIALSLYIFNIKFDGVDKHIERLETKK